MAADRQAQSRQRTWNFAVFDTLLKSTAGEGNETPTTLAAAIDPEGSLELSALPVAANDHLIVTNIEDYTYAFGGAHGGTGDRSFSWWIDSGHALVASDVLRLTGTTRSSLVDLVYKRLRSNHDYGDTLWEAAQVREAVAKELANVSAWQVTREGLTPQACCQLADAVKQGELTSDAITPELIQSKLVTADLPDPDLFIRTSGEQRISNFLIWQLSYAELYFTDVLWPDFNAAELDKALAFFVGRERRFGYISEQLRADNHA